jgi:Trk K+ transport system NAD-binding subunit
MSKQVMVIGLGQFGMALAQALTERGVEVLAVDCNVTVDEMVIGKFVPVVL